MTHTPNPQWQVQTQNFAQWMQAAGRLPSTIANRLRWIKDLQKAYPDISPLELTAKDLQAWISNPNWQPVTRKNAQATIRSFFHYLYITKEREDNPALLLLPVKVPRRAPRPIKTELLAKGIKASATSEETLMILLGAYAGLRRAEIASLHTRDYEDGWLTITGKGGHSRRIPVHPVLAPYLELKSVGYYFPGRFDHKKHRHPDNIAKNITRLLGKGYTTHQLRHWFATTTYSKYPDIRVIQELLGHAHVTTTQSYIGIQDDSLTQAIHALTDLPIPNQNPR